MFDTEAEITTAIKDKESDLSALYDRMVEDFDLFTMTEYEPKDDAGTVRKGYQSYTTSQPRNFFDKVLDGLNRAELTIQIMLPEKATKDEQEKASDGELYLFGALNAIDRRLAQRGEPPLRESLGHFMCLRGLFGVRVLVYVPSGKDETIFDVVPLDPLHLTWETGPEGLIWAAYKRKATKAQIQSEYEVEIKGKDAEVIDFWDTERNGVLIEDVFAKRPTVHNIGHVPILIRFIGSMPTMSSKDFASTIEYQGDSVWSACRKLYEPYNKYVSTVMDKHVASTTGSLLHWSEDGANKIEGDPYRTHKIVPLVYGKEDLKPLVLPASPPEAGAILAIISNDIQQSTLPYPLAYGGTQQAMSGTALSVLSDATRSVYSPRTGAMAQAYTWICEELLKQFVQKGNKTVELQGYKEDDFFYVKAGPETINPDWFVSVRVEPRMPRDEEKEIMMALAATQKRGPEDIPLLSKQTARENILMIRDPASEENRALSEMGKALPPIMATNIAAALKAQGENDLAEQVMMLLRPTPPKQGGTQLPPKLVEAIVAVLTKVGEKELAAGFLQALGEQGIQGAQTTTSGMPPTGAPQGMGATPEAQGSPVAMGGTGEAPPGMV